MSQLSLGCWQVWPKDALEAVAYKFLKEMDLDDPTRVKLVELCQSVHRKVRALSDALVYAMACLCICLLGIYACQY